MKHFALAALAALVLTAGAAAQDNTMMKADKAVPTDGTMMKADPMDASAYNLKGLGPQVVAFTTEKDALMAAKNQTVVYYFAATWCPDCQATYKDLQANFSKIPMNLKLVVVNYDKSADLKKKFGITMQHTFVVLGPMGEKKKVWSGAGTVADIIKNSGSM